MIKQYEQYGKIGGYLSSLANGCRWWEWHAAIRVISSCRQLFLDWENYSLEKRYSYYRAGKRPYLEDAR